MCCFCGHDLELCCISFADIDGNSVPDLVLSNSPIPTFKGVDTHLVCELVMTKHRDLGCTNLSLPDLVTGMLT